MSGAKTRMTQEEALAVLQEVKAEFEEAKPVIVAQAQAPLPENLSITFAHAALSALRAIEGDSSEPEIRNGQVLVNRVTQTAINDADIEARTPAEQAVVATIDSRSKKATREQLR